MTSVTVVLAPEIFVTQTNNFMFGLNYKKRRRDDSPPPPPSDLKLNRIPEPRTYSRKRTKPTNHDIASSSSTSIVRENEVVDEVFEVKVEDPDELDNNNEEIFWQSKTPQESPPPEVKTQVSPVQAEQVQVFMSATHHP
ncbi:hypothetical protein Fcan01_19004 [Folsomia candida]|uniref:Uncharacterized protein n=1 Tax=Folsomia candida TaxID=158441 RepID=A0A226DMG6_FOLCA|nr:hypothetical protein Fcan01_19004 [Folsomia candida]